MERTTPVASAYDSVVKTLEEVAAYRRASHAPRTDQLYYELLWKYHQRLQQAAEDGKPIAILGTDVPVEILYAMDIIPMHMWWASSSVVATLKNYEQAFDLTKAYGLPIEICSSQRASVAVHLGRWIVRPDMALVTTHTCESCNHIAEHIRRTWNIPGFYLDRPRLSSTDDVSYFVHELREMVRFLEANTGRRLDMDRLREMLKYSREMYELDTEVYELKKSLPSPTFNQRIVQERALRRLYPGTPEGVLFYRTMRDEMKAAVETGKGLPERERFRLLSMFLFGFPNRKVAEWMQRERGACLVAAPFDCHWGPWEPTGTDPLENLARLYGADPTTWTLYGPVDNAIQAALEDARDFKVDGAIWWAHRGCNQSCAIIKLVKDKLRDEAGISTVVVDMDVCDPSYVSHDEMKEKIEGYLESLSSS